MAGLNARFWMLVSVVGHQEKVLEEKGVWFNVGSDAVGLKKVEGRFRQPLDSISHPSIVCLQNKILRLKHAFIMESNPGGGETRCLPGSLL